MSNLLAIRVLLIHLFFTASASSIDIADASSTTDPRSAITVPPYVDEAEKAKVTAAPELKRQDSTSTNYCTEWSYINGDPPVGCIVPNTCLFTSVSASGFAYCGVGSSSYVVATACSDYTALTTEPPYQTLHCSSSYPYCHTLKFIADSSDTYTMFGCDSWEGPTTIAYPLAGAVITIQPGNQETTLESATLPISSTTTGEYTTSSTSSQLASAVPAPASAIPSGVNIAAAIGGALGGFASVVIAILTVYKFWSKKKKEPLNP